MTTGGNALKYYCSVRVDVRRKEYIFPGGKKDSEAEGIRVKAKVCPYSSMPCSPVPLEIPISISKPKGWHKKHQHGSAASVGRNIRCGFSNFKLAVSGGRDG